MGVLGLRAVGEQACVEADPHLLRRADVEVGQRGQQDLDRAGVEQVEGGGRQVGHDDGIEAIELAPVGHDARQQGLRVGSRDAGAAIAPCAAVQSDDEGGAPGAQRGLLRAARRAQRKRQRVARQPQLRRGERAAEVHGARHGCDAEEGVGELRHVGGDRGGGHGDGDDLRHAVLQVKVVHAGEPHREHRVAEPGEGLRRQQRPHGEGPPTRAARHGREGACESRGDGGVDLREPAVVGELDQSLERLELDDSLGERRVAHEAAREGRLAVGGVHRQHQRRVDGHGHTRDERLGRQRDVQRLRRLDAVRNSGLRRLYAVRGKLRHVDVHGAVVDALESGLRDRVGVAAEAEDEGVPAGVLSLRRGEARQQRRALGAFVADARLPSLFGRERDAQRAERRGAERIARGVCREHAIERGRAALRRQSQPLDAARGAEEDGGRLVGGEQLGRQDKRDRLALVDVVGGHGRQGDHHRGVVDAPHVLGLDGGLHHAVPPGGLGLHRLERRGEHAAQRVGERARLDSELIVAREIGHDTRQVAIHVAQQRR
eukprot:scaffold124304_cov54-Phaeocystis_antarctica.AAC.1